MTTSNNLEHDLKLWLCKILKNEKLEDISVSISGKSDKGEGYIGDIVFVNVIGTTGDNSKKEFNLALKCSKQNEIIKASAKIQIIFKNEMFFYEELLPTFMEFEDNRTSFTVPKCYGTLTEETIEIIALENLKSSGYELWPKSQPLTRKHIDLVIRAYAKFHAISLALKQQHPQKFDQLMERCKVRDFFRHDRIFKPCFQESLQLLKNEIPEEWLEKWKKLSENIASTFEEVDQKNTLKVFIHGDCWSNNFMYKCLEGLPTDVVILDWQILRYASPICDLSYFLFSCISENDVESIDDILQEYYEHLCENVRKLGGGDCYTFNQFVDDWKSNSKFGVILSTLLIKMCSTDKEDVLDVADMLSKKGSSGDWYDPDKKTNNDGFKRRIRYIVEYVAKNNLI